MEKGYLALHVMQTEATHMGVYRLDDVGLTSPRNISIEIPYQSWCIVRGSDLVGVIKVKISPNYAFEAQEGICIVSSDIKIEENYRRQGVWTRVIEELLEDYQFLADQLAGNIIAVEHLIPDVGDEAKKEEVKNKMGARLQELGFKPLKSGGLMKVIEPHT